MFDQQGGRMTNSEAYRATLERLEADLAQAEAQVERLKAGVAAIKPLVSEDDEDEIGLMPRARTRQVAPEIPPGTTMKDAAVMALAKAGKPVKLRELYVMLMRMGFKYSGDWKQFRASMTPTLRRDPAFRPLGDGVYELRTGGDEMQKAQHSIGAQGLLADMR
jgi:hypothetical protein